MKTNLKKVFVIMVALDFESFEHYCKEPQIFYDNFEDAEIQMQLLIKSKAFEETQMKVQQLWKVKS